MKKSLLCLAMAASCIMGTAAQGAPLALVYSHPNAPTSQAGLQAAFFAKKVAEYTGGSVKIDVYPSSQLGTLQEQAQQVQSGVVAFHHNTAAGIGSIYEDFGVLDTPFIYKNVDHLLRVVDPASSVMKRLNDGLVKKSGVRVLYSFYFGARQLTADRAVRKPADLAGLKIRAIPFPIYQAAVEGMGAVPTPIDWAQTPAALATKVVNGQENPVNTILSAELFKSQSHMMMTNHILGAEIVVVNDAVWQKLTNAQQEQIARAAVEASKYATKLVVDQELVEVKSLKDKGMTVITAAEGLDVEAFRTRTKKIIDERFGAKWGEYYKLISAL